MKRFAGCPNAVWDKQLVVLAFIIAGGVRLINLSRNIPCLDADECAEALMAMDVIHHAKVVIGWYGQDYMGSPEIYLVGGWSMLFGSSPISIRSLMLLIVLMQMIALALIALHLDGEISAVLTLLAMSTVTTMVLGWELRARGYQLMLLGVLIVLYLTVRFLKNSADMRITRNRDVSALVIGAIGGICIWMNELAVFLLLPIFIFTILTNKSRRTFTVFIFSTGILIGYTPRIIYNLKSDFRSLKFLLGSFLGVTKEGWDSCGLAAILLRVAPEERMPKLELFNQVFGKYLIVIFFFAVIAVVIYRNRMTRETVSLLIGLLCSITIVSILSSRVRYATIVVPYLCLFSGIAISGCLWKKASVSIAIILFSCGLINTIHNIRIPDLNATNICKNEKVLLEVIEKYNYKYGISGYDIAHKLMYRSTLGIQVSALGGPVFTTRLIDAEQALARHGGEFVVFFTDDIRSISFEEWLARHSIQWKKEYVGDRFILYHSFSRRIMPGEYLTKEDLKHYMRHRPDSEIKVIQRTANLLYDDQRGRK